MNCCPICFESIGESNKATTECNHTFHVTCLAQAMKSSFVCPFCRKDLATDTAELEQARAEDYSRVLIAACKQVDHIFNSYYDGSEQASVNVSP